MVMSLAIIPAAQNKMWIGTYDGINIFDPATEKFEVLREKDLPGIRGKAIVPVHIDTVRQKAWLYAVSDTKRFYWSGGIYEMDIKTRKCSQIIFRDGAKQFETMAFDPELFKPYKNGILVFADLLSVFLRLRRGVCLLTLWRLHTQKIMTGGMALEEEKRVYINARPNFSLENKNGKWEKIPHLLDSLDWFFMSITKKIRHTGLVLSINWYTTIKTSEKLKLTSKRMGIMDRLLK